MSIRTFNPGNTNNTYDAQADVAYLEAQLFSILYSIGFSDEEIQNLTIDEIIERIREFHPYVRKQSEDDFLTASDLLLKKTNILLIMKVRRIWHRLYLAKVINSNV